MRTINALFILTYFTVFSEKLRMIKKICTIIIQLSMFAVFSQTLSQTRFMSVTHNDSAIATVPAKGSTTIILPVKKWGRYSIQSSGNQPVEISVSDKRNGVFRKDGEAGQRNGRIDLFLDSGDYKIQVLGTKNASSDAKIVSIPFVNRTSDSALWLIPYRDNNIELDDMQQVSYWFEVSSDSTVYIEASGRNLEDLRLWRDGEWMVETNNRIFSSKPSAENPLRSIALSARLSAGLYMVTAYGGAGYKWAKESSSHPLSLQWGIPCAETNVVDNYTIPQKGYIMLSVAANTKQIIISQAFKKRLRSELGYFSNYYSNINISRIDSIYSKSAVNRILLTAGSNNAFIKISGSPGESFTLQTMGSSQGVFGDNSEYRVSTLHSGNYKDQIGASAVIVDKNDNRIVAMDCDTLSSDRGLARKFNLLDMVSMFIWVENDGEYSVTTEGTELNWRVYRYFYSPPSDFKIPDYSSRSETVKLTKGLYIAEINPVKKGIAAITIKKTSFLGSVINATKEMVNLQDSTKKWDAPRPEVQFHSIKTFDKCKYAFVLNSQAPEIASVTLRKYPLDIDIPLGFYIRPAGKISFRVMLNGLRKVSVKDIDGKFCDFEIDGKKITNVTDADSGLHVITITNSAKDTRQLFLKAVPGQLLSSSPVLKFPDEKKAARSIYPILEPSVPQYTDIDRNSSVVYLLNVNVPAIYKLETTGRLATGISIRDRFGNFVLQNQGNGVGRNALLMAYLLSGQYLLTVSSIDLSAGRIGISADTCMLADGGTVQQIIDNRTSVPEFSGVKYQMKIDKKGMYRVENAGQAGNFPFRIEDETGWPLNPVINNGPFEGNLEKGVYSVISMPSEQAGRRIIRMNSVETAEKLKGAGPHTLIVNEAASSVWVENKEKGSVKFAPVVFMLDLPARVTGKFIITSGFNAVLHKVGSNNSTKVGKRNIDLECGKYRLELTPSRKGNYIPYEVMFTTTDLVSGLNRVVNKNIVIRVSVGTESIVRFYSQGMLDVSAELTDSTAKNVIAFNDDGYDDWNFTISKMLKPGRYFLKVKSAVEQFTSTEILMRALVDTVLEPLNAGLYEPRSVQLNLNRHIGLLEIKTNKDADIIAASLKSKSRIGCSIEKKSGDNWSVAALKQGESPFLSIPADPKGIYRLRVWSEDNVDEKINLTLVNTKAEYVSWKKAKDGISGKTINTGNEYCAWFKADFENMAPGHFQTKSGRNTISCTGVSVTEDTSFFIESSGRFAAEQQYAWIELHFENDGKFDVSLEPLQLYTDQQFTTDFLGNRPRVFGTKTGKNTIGFLICESDGYHPFAGVMSNDRDENGILDIRGLKTDDGLWECDGMCAAGVVPADIDKMVIWNALPSLDGTIASSRNTWTTLKITDATQQGAGVFTWNAQERSARLTHVAKCVMKITIPDGNAALFIHENGKRETRYVPGSDSQIMEITTDGGDLYLIALKNEAVFNVACFDSDLQSAHKAVSVSNSGTYDFKALHYGTSRIRLDSKNGKQLVFFRGAVKSVDYITQDGLLKENISSGTQCGPGGFVEIEHDCGWHNISLCKGKSQSDIIACKWGAALSAANKRQIKQSCATSLVNGINWFEINIRDTQHVNISVPVSACAVLLRDGKTIDFAENNEALDWDLPLAAGVYSLGIRSINGSEPDGVRMTVLMRSIEIVSEKKPFTGNLAPGESRLVAIDILKKSQYGIGLRMNRESVHASLLSPDGKMISQGKQQFLELDKGRYYLKLKVPYDAEGTECNVYLFGQELPPDEPPENLVKWILDGAQGERPQMSIDNTSDNEKNQPAWMRLVRGYDNTYERSSEESADSESDGEYDSEDESVENESQDSEQSDDQSEEYENEGDSGE